MTEEIITWETIRDIHREEKSSQKLSKLDANFFEKVQEYIAKKEALGRDTNEIDNIKRIVEELINLRMKKIVTFSTYGTQIENLTIKEKEIFESIKTIIDSYKSHIVNLKPILKPEDVKPIQEVVIEKILEKEKVKLKTGKVIIKALDSIPDFVGLDLKTYSLRTGELITMHKEIADLLVKKGKAEYVNLE